MISVLILAQEDFGKGLLHSVEHVLGKLPAGVELVGVDYNLPPENLIHTLKDRLARLDQGDGILILADVYGASHTNIACRLLSRGHIQLVSGVNLPMLIRVLNYRNLSMDALIAKAMTGGSEGIVCATNTLSKAETGR